MKSMNNPLIAVVLVIVAIAAIAFTFYRSRASVAANGGVDWTKHKRVGGYGKHSQF